MSEARQTRRRFMSFSIRTALAGTAIAGGACYLLTQALSLKRTRRQLALKLEEAGGGTLDYPEVLDVAYKEAHPGTLQLPTEKVPISWLRRLIGDESIYCVIIWNGSIDASTDAEIVAAFPEAVIWRVDDPGGP